MPLARPHRHRPSLRRVLLPLGLALVLGAGLLPVAVVSAQAAGAPGPAAASASAAAATTGTKSFDRKFTVRRAVFSQKVNRCVVLQVRGRIKGTRKTFRHGSGIGNIWRDVRIIKPSLKATTKKLYSHPTGETCGADPVVSKKFVLTQQWTDRGCRWGIKSVSVGLPWSIGAGFGCSGDDDTATRRSSDGRGKFGQQFNTDAVITYKNAECSGQCAMTTKVRASARIHRKMGGGSKSDQVSADFSVVLPGT